MLMINYPGSLQSDLSFSWRRRPGSGLQVRMCFSSCVNRQPHRGLQTASLTVALADRRGRQTFHTEGVKKDGGGGWGWLKIIPTAPHSSFCGCGSAKVPEMGRVNVFVFPQTACFLTGDGRNIQSNMVPCETTRKQLKYFGTKCRIEMKRTCYRFR